MRPELQDIVDEAAEVLGADITLEDRDFNLVAYARQRYDVDSVRTTSILQRRSSRFIRDWFEQFGISASDAPLRTPADAEQGVRSRLCFPVRWRGVTYGYLWALDDATPLQHPSVARGAQLAEHAGSYLAHLSRQRQEDAFALADLLAADVLLADRLNGEPLIVEHGAPIRLVAPAHYGYKNAKHLTRLELRADEHGYRPRVRLLDHPRARVAQEERGQFLPGWILRYAFRPFIEPIVRAIKVSGDSQRS